VCVWNITIIIQQDDMVCRLFLSGYPTSISNKECKGGLTVYEEAEWSRRRLKRSVKVRAACRVVSSFVCYILQGTAMFETAKGHEQVSAGTFLHFAPHEPHGIVVPENNKGEIKMLVAGV
jgi:hypothetical protein